jgi:hypothetical protein
MQFMSMMAEDEKTFKIAQEGIRQSPVFDALKLNILRQADLQLNLVPNAHQISLFKLGRYTDKGWNLLRDSLAAWVDLLSPSTIRKVCTHFSLLDRQDQIAHLSPVACR